MRYCDVEATLASLSCFEVCRGARYECTREVSDWLVTWTGPVLKWACVWVGWQARRTAALGALEPSTLPTARTRSVRRRCPRKPPTVRAKRVTLCVFPFKTRPLRLTTCSHCRFRVASQLPTVRDECVRTSLWT